MSVILCNQVTNFSGRGTASPVCLLQGTLIILIHKAYFAISVFWQKTKNTMLPWFWCHIRRTFRIWVLRKVCGQRERHVRDVRYVCALLLPFSKISQTVVRISTVTRRFCFDYGVIGLYRLSAACSSLRSEAGLEKDKSCNVEVNDALVPVPDDNYGNNKRYEIVRFA